MTIDQFEKILATYPQYKLQRDVPASTLTTFRIGGKIGLVVLPESGEGMVQAVRLCLAADMPYRIVGNGSNILAADEDFEGVWIITTGYRDIQILENHVDVSAGVLLDNLIDRVTEAELGGLENLAGIPGSIGGAVVMNAGAYGTVISDLIVAVNVYDIRRNELYSIPYESCGFSYRRSMFQSGGYLVLGVSLRLGCSRRDLIAARAAQVRERRRTTQPSEYPSAGSVFRRPRGHYAGKLISEAGFSGYRVGDAAVAEKHNGFIINLGHATSEDVKTIISQIRKRVFESKGVLLQTEIIIA